VRRIILGVLLVFAAWLAFADFESARSQAQPWMAPVVTPNERDALEWVIANTPERAVFVTDIFGGEFLMGNTRREGTVGGDWAVIPNVVERMHDIQYAFYQAKTPEEAHATALKYGAEYVWAPDRKVFAGYEWVELNRSLFVPPYFSLEFDNGAAIYRVNPA